jgi:hypothetical protein
MSRGPGRIERAIRELFDASPDLAFISVELVEHCFPGGDQAAIARKHLVSVLRAAHKIAAADPDWTAWRIEGQGRGWVFLNHANVQSYALARLIADTGFHCYRSPKRARRRRGRYIDRWDGHPLTDERIARWRAAGNPCIDYRGQEITSAWLPHDDLVVDRAKLLADLAPGERNHHLVEPGGAWVDHVEEYIAALAGAGCAKRGAPTPPLSASAAISPTWTAAPPAPAPPPAPALPRPRPGR